MRQGLEETHDDHAHAEGGRSAEGDGDDPAGPPAARRWEEHGGRTKEDGELERKDRPRRRDFAARRADRDNEHRNEDDAEPQHPRRAAQQPADPQTKEGRDREKDRRGGQKLGDRHADGLLGDVETERDLSRPQRDEH